MHNEVNMVMEFSNNIHTYQKMKDTSSKPDFYAEKSQFWNNLTEAVEKYKKTQCLYKYNFCDSFKNYGHVSLLTVPLTDYCTISD